MSALLALPMVAGVDDLVLARSREALECLRRDIEAAEAGAMDQLRDVHPTHRASAVNLVHYVALRRHDIRALQHDLATLGVSSLSHLEQSVREGVDTVISVLDRLAGVAGPPIAVGRGGSGVLAAHADRLLGATSDGQRTRVMVTLPSEAATDAELVAGLVAAGMDIARINCAHDDPAAWEAMAANVRAAGQARIAVDLAGPKLRTGPIEPAPPALKLSPARDARGAVVRPAYALLVGPESAAITGSDGRVVPVDDPAWISRRQVGETVAVADARGTVRSWTVVDTVDGQCLVAVHRTTYLAPGATLRADSPDGEVEAAHVGDLPRRAQHLRIQSGHRVVLVASDAPVAPSVDGDTVHRIGCTLAEVVRDCRPGERVFFDDGKLAGVIESIDTAAGELTVRVGQVPPGGVKLHGGKGINLPDTDLHLPALSDADLAALDAVLPFVDIVDVSFVRTATDVEDILQALAARGATHVGLVLKIETAGGFRNLPAIVLAAMRHERVGVMIARGDLAVEVGFERLAEVQEEILWLCEAARVPVIWATEVLDSMARTGRPSRAEITDAARAHRAECVMLNKGPHVADAVRSVRQIVERMHEHQSKKQHLLRRLHAWDEFPSG